MDTNHIMKKVTKGFMFLFFLNISKLNTNINKYKEITGCITDAKKYNKTEKKLCLFCHRINESIPNEIAKVEALKLISYGGHQAIENNLLKGEIKKAIKMKSKILLEL